MPTAGRCAWPRVTGRPKMLVFSYCYHGTVDETFVDARRRRAGRAPRAGNVGPPVDPTMTTRVVEFNDLDAVERALADGHVACVLMEPALTNIGIVLPEPGFLDGVARSPATDRHAADQRRDPHDLRRARRLHRGLGPASPTWSRSARRSRGGIPIGAYGLSAELADADRGARPTPTSSTSAASAARWPATRSRWRPTRATLGEVLTAEAFARMTALRDRFVAGVRGASTSTTCRGRSSQLGCRAPSTASRPTRRATAARARRRDDAELEDFLHLYLLNRGVLITPFHNMALMCPATTGATSTGTPSSSPSCSRR